MERIKTNQYTIHNRHFELHTYRDTNNDTLVIEPIQTSTGKKQNVAHLKAYVHTEGVFDQAAEKYPGYKKALAAVKESLAALVNQPAS
jgi:ribosomal protein S24E